jgi:hypothetical protein
VVEDHRLGGFGGEPGCSAEGHSLANAGHRPNSSGPSQDSRKIKMARWREENPERWRLFEKH